MSMSAEQRKDPRVAEAMLKRLFPKRSQRDDIVQILAEATVLAHALGPDKWGMSLLDKAIRLNLGGIEVLALKSNLLHLVVFGPKLPAAFKEYAEPGYAKVPQSCILNAGDLYLQVWEDVKPAWRELARRASETAKHSMTQKAHSPGVLVFLRQLGWKDVPNPLSAA